MTDVTSDAVVPNTGRLLQARDGVSEKRFTSSTCSLHSQVKKELEKTDETVPMKENYETKGTRKQ